MKSITVSVDHVADAAYIRLSDNPVATTVEVNEDVIVDLDAMNVAVGVELLDIAAEIPFSELTESYHVHSSVVELLRLLRPSIAQSILQGGNDGATTPIKRAQMQLV